MTVEPHKLHTQGAALPSEELVGGLPRGGPGPLRAYLSNVCVADAARRQGVAQCLIDAAAQQLSQQVWFACRHLWYTCVCAGRALRVCARCSGQCGCGGALPGARWVCAGTGGERGQRTCTWKTPPPVACSRAVIYLLMLALVMISFNSTLNSWISITAVISCACHHSGI